MIQKFLSLVTLLVLTLSAYGFTIPNTRLGYHYFNLGSEEYRIDRNSLKDFLSNIFVAAATQLNNVTYEIGRPIHLLCSSSGELQSISKCKLLFCGEYLNEENNSFNRCNNFNVGGSFTATIEEKSMLSKLKVPLVSCKLHISSEEESISLFDCGGSSFVNNVPESIGKNANKVFGTFEDVGVERVY